MTNYPGEGQPPQDPNQPDPSQQPGYWEQQQPVQPPQPYGYPPQGYQQPGYQQPPQPYQTDHPKATTSLVLGILGLVVCGVIAPFAWSMGKKTVQEIDASGGRLGGRGAAQAGYICGIIGTCLLALGLIFVIIYIIIIAAVVGTEVSTS